MSFFMTLPISITVYDVFHYVCVMFTNVMVLQILFWLQQNLVQKLFQGFRCCASNLQQRVQQRAPGPGVRHGCKTPISSSRRNRSHQLLGHWVWLIPMQHNLHQHDINDACHCRIRWLVEVLSCLLGFCRIQNGSNVILYYICNYLFVCHYLFGPLLRDIWCDICVNSIDEML